MRFRAAVGGACVVALSLMVACDDGSGAEPDPPSTAGPLSVAVGGGGHVSLPAKKRGQGSDVVFGGLLMCTTTREPVTIRSIEFRSEVASAAVGSAVRRIPPSEERDDPESMRWSPIIALRGDLFGERLSRQLGGEIVDGAEGFVVDEKCQKRQPGQALTELMTTVAATAEGASVDGQVIAYEAVGQDYSVEVPWWFVVCGTKVTRDDTCARQVAP